MPDKPNCPNVPTECKHLAAKNPVLEHMMTLRLELTEPYVAGGHEFVIVHRLCAFCAGRMAAAVTMEIVAAKP